MTPGIIIFWHFVFAVVGGLVGIVIGYRMKRPSKESAPPTIPTQKPVIEADTNAIKAGWTADGKPWLEMDGIQLLNKTELNQDQQKRLTNLVQGLSPWVEAVQPAQAAPIPAPVSPQKVMPPIKVSPREKKETPVAPAMESIIQQINGVLQAKLASSAFKNRGIQLLEGPGGAVLVEDGLKSYEGIEAVPDAEVKSLIREAIAEWEKKH